MRRLSTSFLFILALSLLCASAAGASCIKRHQVPIAKGNSPSGHAWAVTASIGNNGSGCRDWLFGMDFRLDGAVDWGSGTGIPAGGHLRRGYGISADDDLLEDGSDRVFSGFVTAEVAKVAVTLSNNKRLVIHPRSVPASLRRRIVWLHNVRYFVTYYPPLAFATGVATFDASGRLLYRDKTFESF
jgi:hypothetical protein